MFKIFIIVVLSLNAHAYDRKEWKHWTTHGNCQNTRQKVLIERSLIPVTFTNNKKCVVQSGKWNDFYFNEILSISKEIDIDHVLPLKYTQELLDKYKIKWDSNQKEMFANDPENLVITNKHYNRQKGAKSIFEWSPVQKDYACKYGKKWLIIKRKYKLPIKNQEIEYVSNFCKK